jgi:hypothetical protein
LSTGDWSAPWQAVDIQAINLTIKITGVGPAGSTTIARFAGPYGDGLLELERNNAGLYRLREAGGAPDWPDEVGDWRLLRAGTVAHVRIGPVPNYSFYEVSSPDLLLAGYPALFPVTDRDNHGDYTVGLPYILQEGLAPGSEGLIGVQATSLRDPPSRLCKRLISR